MGLIRTGPRSASPRHTITLIHLQLRCCPGGLKVRFELMSSIISQEQPSAASHPAPKLQLMQPVLGAAPSAALPPAGSAVGTGTLAAGAGLVVLAGGGWCWGWPSPRRGDGCGQPLHMKQAAPGHAGSPAKPSPPAPIVPPEQRGMRRGCSPA